ncbi:uncharacterized protein CDAR_376491 [Caerostris darwini]|uniref:Uncharacterized protein n=1 Tax=Caerostris darwini TaxID=1538125 RepID=A0AAV4N8W4_9ARAC|nr:uncharacterized protein CDAR_376491 [Caerostris darwini]
MEDLGCFYTGDPFFSPLSRPISLPPISNPSPKFWLFTPSNPKKAFNLEINTDSLRKSPFNSQVESKFIIHGFYFPLPDDDIRYVSSYFNYASNANPKLPTN